MTLNDLKKTEVGLKDIAIELKPLPHTIRGDALLNALNLVRAEIYKEERRRRGDEI